MPPHPTKAAPIATAAPAITTAAISPRDITLPLPVCPIIP
jgi:hypothetical protein